MVDLGIFEESCNSYGHSTASAARASNGLLCHWGRIVIFFFVSSSFLDGFFLFLQLFSKLLLSSTKGIIVHQQSVHRKYILHHYSVVYYITE